MDDMTEVIEFLSRLSERINMAREMIAGGLVKRRNPDNTCPSSKGFCVIGEFLIADTQRYPKAIEAWQAIIDKRPDGEPFDDVDINDPDEPEPDDRETCQCPFCHCSVKTNFGICDMCSQGAHQG